MSVGDFAERRDTPKKILDVGDEIKVSNQNDGEVRSMKTDPIKGIGKHSMPNIKKGKTGPVRSGYFRGQEPFEDMRIETGGEDDSDRGTEEVES